MNQVDDVIETMAEPAGRNGYPGQFTVNGIQATVINMAKKSR
jgi:hypothetical protein